LVQKPVCQHAKVFFYLFQAKAKMPSKIRYYLYFDAKKVSFFWFRTKAVKQNEAKASSFFCLKAKKVWFFCFASRNLMQKDVKKWVRCFRLSSRIGSKTDIISLLSEIFAWNETGAP
jgi:hypothetical protein